MVDYMTQFPPKSRFWEQRFPKTVASFVAAACLVAGAAGSSQAQSRTSQIPTIRDNQPQQRTTPPGLERESTTRAATRKPDPYTLGPGDTIQISVFNMPELSGEGQQILADGSISLPLIGNVFLQGLTLQEASNLLSERLSRYVKRPDVTLSLQQARPLDITVVGQVNRPGSYSVSPEGEGSVIEGQVLGARTLGSPTLTAAIKLAGGITKLANVRQVKVERLVGRNETKTINVNLWKLLQTGNLSQDITLRDGDRITVPTARKVTPAEATQLAEASFAPDTISVNVVGEVKQPGTVEIEPNSPLNQAILAAGGFDKQRAQEGKVKLIRLNRNGSVTRRTIPINFAQGINPKSNPILRHRDVIVVGRSDVTSVSDTLETIFSPVTSILDLISDIF